MEANDKKLQAYNEAKEICFAYKNYKGDKRSQQYKTLERCVVDLFMNRMTSFGKQLGLPTFNEAFNK